MHDEKYIVFKRDEYMDLVRRAEPEPLEDAVVIRTQDVFAAAGLSAYAHNIRAYVFLLQTMPVSPRERELAGNLAERLEGVADYFEGCAQEAEDRQARGDVKVPD